MCPQVVRRQSLRRKATLTSLLFGEDEAAALKSKNIKQTELVAALRDAITRTAEHFHCLDPHHSSTVSPPWCSGSRMRVCAGDGHNVGFRLFACRT